ncbi:hypothetical protein CEE37_13885 [candidate division LCP-89 bacterium B3_LCP]|uniref:Type II secretion system protein GspG C-terminal domain-containing protein n=1 Tax=candidate division LCP-89 bacterium B3_LCP TaxID=2012998 RepID=A0A532URN9_UNCL8|nr:MAG: hypothetical protein CEE37_13885 [candidate division LCP-89 bacterium B3_LCP]
MRRYLISFILLAALTVSLMQGCAGTRKAEQVKLRAQRVQATLTDIAEALEKYQQDKGYFPKGMATLRNARYLSIMPDLEREWKFEYFTDGGNVMMVEAVSRSSMPDGSGHRITYRVPSDVWEGYGITEFP